VEWVRQPGELPIEQDAPKEVPPRKTTILIPYGSLFYAATQAFEEALPEVTEDTDRSVVILSLRQRDDLGSTFFVALERYSEKLGERNSRFILVEVSEKTMTQFENTGHKDIFGRDNVFLSTDRPYESALDALHQADKWIAEQNGGDRETNVTEAVS
jgi:SulP family sulfate permease